MQISFWLLMALTLFELVLFILLLIFFARLRRSEQMLVKLQSGQSTLLTNIHNNAEIERDLISSFAERQQELAALNMQLEERAATLRTLLGQAEAVSRSPQFLRELIVSGTKQGKSPQELAKGAGLSLDEVRLILAQVHQQI